MPKPTRGARPRRSAAAALLACLTTVVAAQAQEAVARFAIPAQPLASGLLALGRQARISIAAPAALVAGKTGRPVQGELTVKAALERMLEGTGLRYEFVGANAVRIRAADADRRSSLGGALRRQGPRFQQP